MNDRENPYVHTTESGPPWQDPVVWGVVALGAVAIVLGVT